MRARFEVLVPLATWTRTRDLEGCAVWPWWMVVVVTRVVVVDGDDAGLARSIRNAAPTNSTTMSSTTAVAGW